MTVRVRKFPATTGIDLVGACGHPYKTRIKLPGYLAGRTRTAFLEHRLVEVKQLEEEQLKKTDCPDCHAADTLDNVRVNSSVLTDQYGLDMLPHLSGTRRTIAFGEGLRLQAWHEQIAMICQQVHTVAQERNSLSLHLAITALHRLYPDRGAHAPDSPAPFVATAECCPRGPRTPIPERISLRLAEWLLVRHATRANSHMLYGITDASEWISFGKGSRSGRYSPFRRDMTVEVLPALLVASYRGWADIGAAEQAFQTLLTSATDSASGFLDALAGKSLPEAMEATTVFAALQPAAHPIDPPF